MELEALIDAVESSEHAGALLRPYRGRSGLSKAYFGRLLAIYGDDVGRAVRLAKHWRVLAAYGDEPALAYRAKGFVDRMAGRWRESAQAFLRASDLAEGAEDRLAYAIGAVDGLARSGKVEEARRLGTRLAEGLDELNAPVLAARARLNTANALLWAERGPEARALYQRAIPVFQASEMAMEEASARLGLSTTHLYGGDPRVAALEAEAGRALCEENEFDYIGALCEVNLAHFALVQGRADEAYARLLALRPRLEESPADLARVHEYMGDACLRLNLFTEAAEAYRTALASPTLPAASRGHVLLGLGEAERDPVAFTKAAERYRRAGNGPWRAAALAGKVSLHPEGPRALHDARAAREAAGASPYHQTLALLAEAEALLAHGRDAGTALTEADRLVRRYGYRRFAWRIHELKARGAAKPLPHYRRMFAEIMRERIAVTSVAARTGFLEDKSRALAAYLSALLANPTRARVAAAREVIRRTRAVTLLDEILRSGSLTLDAERRERLEALRAQVVADAIEEPTPDARGAAAVHPKRSDWMEATHVLGALDHALPPVIAEDVVVFAQAGDDLWALVDRGAVKLPISARELEETLEWLWFELRVPTADREAPPEEALDLLRDLRNALVAPWARRLNRPRHLCPDGLLWRVPWSALLPRTVPLSLHPSLGGGTRLGKIERVAVWIDTPPDLPNAPAEEETIRRRFPQARFLRTRAEVVDSWHEAWDLVHVVGHARHNAENPMFSALAFSDGPLYAAEIARGGLRTRLACLSACETGTLSHAVRSEPDGLVRAFLARGGEGVLASLWPLDDEAAARFFSAFYTDLNPCSDLTDTVDRARSAVRAWRAHPYFWASLSLFGGYQP